MKSEWESTTRRRRRLRLLPDGVPKWEERGKIEIIKLLEKECKKEDHKRWQEKPKI